jgi:hypothetical protein
MSNALCKPPGGPDEFLFAGASPVTYIPCLSHKDSVLKPDVPTGSRAYIQCFTRFSALLEPLIVLR